MLQALSVCQTTRTVSSTAVTEETSFQASEAGSGPVQATTVYGLFGARQASSTVVTTY